MKNMNEQEKINLIKKANLLIRNTMTKKEYEMSYLKRVVKTALLKNPAVADDAESYAEGMEEFKDLLRLDAKNLRLVADELGATPQQFVGFLEVVKAIYNGGKVENEIYIKGYINDGLKKVLLEHGQDHVVNENE